MVWSNISIIATLILLETLLSIDNAVVLAILVAPLPPKDQAKALRYGIIGAYVFRGLCLLFATWLIHIWWLKIIGGAYLVWIAYDYFKSDSPKDGDVIASDRGLIGKLTPYFGALWATIIAVELLDITFSIDNIFAAVALTDNIWLIMGGVFVGILAMRFVAQSFVGLMKKYPRLESAAFLVIGLLGLKLVIGTGCSFLDNSVCHIIESETFDIVFSFISIAIFALPILEERVFKKKNLD
jgi:YkoY family integral membrane protein